MCLPQSRIWCPWWLTTSLHPHGSKTTVTFGFRHDAPLVAHNYLLLRNLNRWSVNSFTAVSKSKYTHTPTLSVPACPSTSSVQPCSLIFPGRDRQAQTDNIPRVRRSNNSIIPKASSGVVCCRLSFYLVFQGRVLPRVP